MTTDGSATDLYRDGVQQKKGEKTQTPPRFITGNCPVREALKSRVGLKKVE